MPHHRSSSSKNTNPPSWDIGDIPGWDLDFMYSGLKSKKLKEDMKSISEVIELFSECYKGRVSSLGGEALGKAVKEYETIIDSRYMIDCYVELLESENQDNFSKTRTVKEWLHKTDAQLSFFEGEINGIKETHLLAKMAAPEFSQYAQWIARVRADKHHMLSPGLEKISRDFNSLHGGALRRLFHETLSGLEFEFEGEILDYDEINSERASSDIEVSDAARKEMTRVFKKNSKRMAHIYNALIKDKEVEDRWRKYDRPDQGCNQANHLENEVVDTMFDTIKGSYAEISHRYFAWIAKSHGEDVLKTSDMKGSVLGDQEEGIPWNEARLTILRAFKNFSPRLDRIARRFFDDEYIDAKDRPNKYPGAFAMPTGPNSHPYILMNYQGYMEDLMTLAHELGHGCHQVLAEKAQGNFLSEMSDTISETASVFAEMLVFEELMKKEKDPLKKMRLLESKVGDMIGTGLEQLAYYDFEKRVHAARKNGELDSEQISDIWVDALQEYYGPSIELDEFDRYTWITVPHFFETPFYVYSYSFGQMLVCALYEKYEEGSDPDFKDKYFALLEAGITKNLHEMLSPFDLNPEEPEFWEKGLSLIEKYLDKLEGFTPPKPDMALKDISSHRSGIVIPPRTLNPPKPPRP